MDYSCDVSNRYIGFLDSSDHGNSMTSSATQNKRKTKKKRKPKHSKLIDKCINTEPSPEATDVTEDVTQNQEQSTSNAKQSLPTDTIPYDTAIKDQQPINHEIEKQTAECPLNGAPKCGSSEQSDTLHNGTNDNATDVDDMNVDTVTAGSLNPTETKWSEICFEEEKSLMAQEQNKSSEDAVTDPELVFNEHRVYPTVYFYNSNFGNGNCRTFDWYDSDRRGRFNNQPDTTNSSALKKVHQKPQHRKSYNTSTGTDDTYMDEKYSVDGRYADSYNESNDRSSQYTNESNHREFTNSTNHYKKYKHGTTRFHSNRSFTRRRSDFVRNV